MSTPLLNDSRYTVDEFAQGFGWSNKVTESEGFYATYDLAVTAANEHARAEQMEVHNEAQWDDRYDREYHQSFNNRDYR